MAARKKRRNTPGNNGKQSKPRRGEKTKPVKVNNKKETETKGVRQTKLAFTTTGSPEKTSEPKTKIDTVIVLPVPNDKEAKTPAVPPVTRKKLTFAETTGTPTKKKTDNENPRSTAITPEPKTGPTADPLPKSPTQQDKKRQQETNTNNDNDNDNDNDNYRTRQDTYRSRQDTHQPRQDTYRTTQDRY
jgi:hypothetical protein